jgi:hypothetical protein
VHRRLDPDVAQDLVQLTVPAGSSLERVDWVDYEERISATSGRTLAREAMRLAGDGGVWVLSSPRYRTHQRTCATLRRELSDTGVPSRVVVPLDYDTYEYSWLERWSVAPALREKPRLR